MTANMTPVASTTTSTKITYNQNDYQIYKGKPSYTWVNDTNTGMYHPADNQITFTIDGTEVVKINSAGLMMNGTQFTGGSGGSSSSISATAPLSLSATNVLTLKPIVFQHLLVEIFVSIMIIQL